MLFVLWMIAVFICGPYLQWWALQLWILALGISKTMLNDTLKRHYDIIIEDYPRDDCVEPKICKKLFWYASKKTGKGIPKDIYYAACIEYIGFWTYTAVGGVAFLFSERAALVIGLIYNALMGISGYFMSRADRKCFYSRYKMLNRYNFKYYMLGRSDDYPRKVGKCEIVREYRKRRKTFTVVRMADSGEMVEDVLLPGNKRQGEHPLYNMYEICKVKYIV